MSVTLAVYQANLLAKGYDAQTSPNVLVAINAARREIVAEQAWTFLETENASLVTAIGVPTVSLAAVTTLAHPDSVRLSVGNDDYPIDFLPPQQFKDRQQCDGRAYNGIPSYWTYYAGGLQFTPRPDKVYTVSFDFLAKVTDLAAPGDVCVIPDMYQDVVGWLAAKHLSFRGRDQAGLTMAGNEYIAGLRRMSRADGRVQRQTDSTVRDVL